MKKVIFFTVIVISMAFTNCTAGNPENNEKKISASSEVKQLTTAAFKTVIYDYAVNKEWKYEGSMPAIIDFYADWCPPCRQLSPIVEDIAREYHGRILVYRVNTDNEKGLAMSLGISNLPTLLYIPAKGKPHVTLGMIPREKIVKTINETLLTK